ncbi:chromate efflux transporter [Pseudomonas guariconensis]|uniref:chromate efflux transporter n=1 Tax=Pseudomonas TaxID=286 RepID=UPI001CE41869|nr:MULTISPECIES: chromate efflux transporter [Pseudomonas]MCO7635243.1 chromate efflux transporter [Pseudomonas sp. S 311-6]MCO7513698.1 chromate efflux transporter [Pseudomonas putida]MCO7563587.1 chromate efflux transporter [Pseudomonas mosselii]MCO7595432.1 chromate efflux transporter [Pseudomonas guariconensis]MCO7603901.1 chromate efflux transporter [Pseudomonas guariconensis]
MPIEHPVPFRQAMLFWLKLGFIGFGGPAGQIALMHREIVERRRWLSESRFLHALNYCMLLPGPEAQQLATYLGWLMHRTWGGIVAGALFVLPSLFILIGLSWVYVAHGQQPVVAGLFYGLKPAITAIVLQAAWRIGSRVLHNAALWAVALAAFVALFGLGLPFPLIILGAALLGYLGGRWQPRLFQAAHEPLPDASPAQPGHTRWRWPHLLRLLACGAALWCLPMGLLLLLFGWQGTFTQMAWFFTKAALLTFGGAYAVLPYVYQGAVSHFGWLTPTQMIDGLALGESTPGPLIMLVVFVAFVGAYAQAPLGADQAFLAGALAACLVTWFTFLPSFLFILIGAPLVESTRRQLRFSAPLTAISAAVVGVIINLALFFGYHVFWPHGFAQGIDWLALLVAVLAAVGLLLFRRGVLEVLLACALAGLLAVLYGYQA